MLVEELEILVPVLPALGEWDEMVDFPVVLQGEQEPAPEAVPPLSFEEPRYSC
jgi:hypothetical protein